MLHTTERQYQSIYAQPFTFILTQGLVEFSTFSSMPEIVTKLAKLNNAFYWTITSSTERNRILLGNSFSVPSDENSPFSRLFITFGPTSCYVLNPKSNVILPLALSPIEYSSPFILHTCDLQLQFFMPNHLRTDGVYREVLTKLLQTTKQLVANSHVHCPNVDNEMKSV